jgi:Fic family protein
LQIEAAAHVRVQAEVDRMAAENRLPEPASADFVRWLHREFYCGAPQEMLRITHGCPGKMSRVNQSVAAHVPQNKGT